LEEDFMSTQDVKIIAIVGLGYVGLPLAVAFGKKIKTIGFDISSHKIENYTNGIDPAGEMTEDELKKSIYLSFTSDPHALKEADICIVAVPTPIKTNKLPDLAHLVSASETVGKYMKKGAIVVYESTVYPGVTEDVCAPVLEEASGMKSGVDFKVAYSPERINPGDKEHTLEKIVKVVAAQDQETLDIVAGVYESVVKAGVYKAQGIKVAEAAKVIENTQRDLNIALMNELAIIFNHLGIDTQEVIKTASTKWNFLPFKPGLVGGHCIGVDPYYLTYCAQQLGYQPEVILAGRRINDSMGKYIATCTVKELIHSKARVEGARVLILGLTFKENCADIRNTKVIDIIDELNEYGIKPLVHDPTADPVDTEKTYGISLIRELPSRVDAVIAAVTHDFYVKRGAGLPMEIMAPDRGVVVDIKGIYCKEDFKGTNIRYWRL
jgi:UDP-N-acetyl-D-galactosamine dehydrogenase